VPVVTREPTRRAGGPAGSFASSAGGAILDAMGAALTSPTFVGRADELARLAAARDRAAAGTPTTVLVGGEAGVGKTRLVGEAMAGARAAGARVLAGGCVELGGEGVPFAPLIEALRGFVRDLAEPELAELFPGRTRAELARLLPELGPAAGDAVGGRAAFGGDPGPWSDQGRLFELLLGLLERLGRDRPAVLVVEDLHWADRSTRDLLAFLVRNLRQGRLLLVLTYRGDELHRRHPLRPFLAELDRGRRVERLELARFGPEEVAAQLAGIQGAPAPAELAARIHARSGGNAFFVEELAAAATTAANDDGELPPSLRDTLLARIELLAEPTQQVLGVAAAAGARVEHDLLAAVAGLAEPELLGGLREAVSAHVLLVDAVDGTYGFRHALVKEAVYGELLPGERTRLHARFAAALAARDGGASPGLAAELAWHWYAAHDLGRALPAAVEAGMAAERAYAYAEAQRQFERALELWERADPAPLDTVAGLDKAALLARAGEAAANAGATDRAVALFRGALAQVDAAADPLLAGQLTERLAFHLRVAGRPGAFEAYQEAVRLVPPTPPTPARARVLAGLGQALMLRARFAEAKATCEEAIEVARAAGALAVEVHALNTLGAVTGRLGDIDGGLARLHESRRLAAELGLAKDEARACVNLSDLLDDLGRFEEAVAMASDGMEVARAAGLQRTFGAFLAGNAAASLYHLGRWDEHVRLTDAYLDQSDEQDFNTVTLGQARAVLDAGRGDFDTALARTRAAQRLASDPFIAVQYPPVMAAVEAEVAAWQGRLDDAAAAVADGLATLQGPLVNLRGCMLLVIGLRVEGRRVELAVARQDHDTIADARLVAQGLVEWARGFAGSEVTWHRALLATCEAEWSGVVGEADPQAWLAAVAAWDEAGVPYPAAVARWRAAEVVLARRGDRRLAGDLLREGHAAAAALGAGPLRRELERLARLGRVDLAPAGAAAPAAAGGPSADAEPEPEALAGLGLTAREVEVLRLVAEGRSNRQVAEALFISAKTASVHVSNILAKLGVASRVEAASVAHRLGLLA
jgi:DNA-binding CsgD family transcriptional regulator/tetratricopeptide (TPR) repeat protein